LFRGGRLKIGFQQKRGLLAEGKAYRENGVPRERSGEDPYKRERGLRESCAIKRGRLASGGRI